MPRKKTSYWLYWEFLKRSKKYNEWCKKSRKNQNGYTWREQFTKAYSTNGKSQPFYATYLFFGDIFSCSFDEWWSSFTTKRHDSVGLFYHYIESDFADAIDQFYSRQKRNPTLNEFQEEFKARVKGNPWKVYLIINLDPGRNLDIKSLFKEFRIIMEKEFKKRVKCLKPTFITRFENRFRFKEFKRYLDVHGKAEEFKKSKREYWRENLLDHFHPDTGDDVKRISDINLPKEEKRKLQIKIESRLRKLERDIYNAQTMISNVENEFPPVRFEKGESLIEEFKRLRHLIKNQK